MDELIRMLDMLFLIEDNIEDNNEDNNEDNTNENDRTTNSNNK